MAGDKIIIFTDGGARGNPGPAAVGVVIFIPSLRGGAEAILKEGQYIGETTNNVAEYKAVILALEETKKVLKNKAKKSELEINVDSELLYKQVRGEYKVKMPHLKPLVEKVKDLMDNFKSVEFNLVPREKNKEADKLVNKVLDSL